MNRTALYGAAVLLLLFSACELLGPKPGAEDGPEGKAAVRIAITAPGRTALPAVAVEDAAWELWGGEPSELQNLITELSGASTLVYLETGDWDFTVKGSNGDGAVILQGTLTGQTISLEKPNTLNFTVAPHRDGKGTYKITIELPDGHGITTAKVWKDDSLIKDELEMEDDNTIVFEEEYPAGDYYFSVRLYKDTTLYGVVSETAQLRANLRSESEKYTLTAENLNIVYTINYHLDDGGELDSPNPDFYQSVEVGFDLPQPTWDGYDFEGWRLGAVGGEKVANLPQSSKGDRDFYAKWTPVAYPINYRPEGIDYGETQGTYTIEDEVTLKVPSDPEGFHFDGWYNDSLFQSPITGVAISKGETGPKTFHAKWDPGVLVHISLQPQPDDPAPSNASLSVDGEAEFSAAGAGYKSWQWRWDGEPIKDATLATYTLEATYKTPGVYELSVVVITNDEQTLSARCRVTITEEGDPE